MASETAGSELHAANPASWRRVQVSGCYFLKFAFVVVLMQRASFILKIVPRRAGSAYLPQYL
jgi:hypothetical protein